jgi:hypothetical protein
VTILYLLNKREREHTTNMNKTNNIWNNIIFWTSGVLTLAGITCISRRINRECQEEKRNNEVEVERKDMNIAYLFTGVSIGVFTALLFNKK